MAPTSEAGLSKDDHYLEEGIPEITSCSSLDATQFLGDFDNSCETFFCRRNSPLLSRSVIPEASSTFQKVLGDMGNWQDEDSCADDEEEDDWRLKSSHKQSSSSPSTASPSSSRSSQITKSKPISMPSCKLSSSQSNFLSVPSSLVSLGSPTHADFSDSGAHKTLAGLSMRKTSAMRPNSFGGSDSVKYESTFPSRRGKRVSWADERGHKHQLISVRLIRPRLSMDITIGASTTPSHSILRRQDQVSV